MKVERVSRGWGSLRRGFTLVELMIVVVILGLLAAIAVPAFTRYVKRGKTAEATATVSSMYRLQLTYYENTQERSSSTTFATCEQLPTPAPSASKYPASVTLWMNSSSWSALGFVIDRPHYYQYVTTGSASGFTARAVGDIDGDTVLSTFERSGIINSGEIQGTRLHIVNELE